MTCSSRTYVSQPPFTTTLVAGTQASSAKANKLTVMRLCNVKRPVDEDDEGVLSIPTCSATHAMFFKTMTLTMTTKLISIQCM